MAIQPGQATLSDLLNGNGKRVPKWELVAELVQACTTYAHSHGRQLSPELASLAWWRKTHDDLTKVMDAVWRASRQAHARQEPKLLARPIAEWNPSDLGVKKAIKEAAAIGQDQVEEPPIYIARACDSEIHSALREDSKPIFIVVVGESGAGKTRACLEGIKETVPNKPVIFPTSPEELSGILEKKYDLSGHIVWLDETQMYLDGEESPKLANLLTALLVNSSQSVTIIGTMWPKYWRTLTARPPENQPDHTARVRKLLSLNSIRRIKVDATFSGVPHEIIDSVALLDRRIAIAATACGPRRNIAQILAGGVQLLDRYENSLDTYERALVTASMDFRRIGFYSPASARLLEHAIEGYLSAEHRVVNTDWISTALEGATWQVNGIRALEPVRTIPGLGSADSYVLHDYLDGHAQQGRRELPVPGSVWQALNIYARNPDDRVRISWQASIRSYERLSVEFLSAVVVADYSAEGGLRLTWALERAGHVEKAMDTLQRAANAGETSAMRELAQRLLRSQGTSAAAMWLRRAAELGDTEAMIILGSYPFALVDLDEADSWLQRAANLGDIWAMRELAYRYIDFSPRFALDWFRRGAETGEGNLMLDLVEALHQTSHHQECAEWTRRLGESGQLHMTGPLAEWLEGQGRVSEAEFWLRRYADVGDMTACCNLSELLERAGRGHQAVAVWRTAIESLKLEGMSSIVANRIADQIVRAGESGDAMEWLRRAADGGSPYAVLILIELADIPDAENLLRKSIALGNNYSTPALVNLLERDGRETEAEVLLRSCLENLNYPNSGKELEEFLVRNGRSEEADAFKKYGIEPGGNTADPW